MRYLLLFIFLCSIFIPRAVAETEEHHEHELVYVDPLAMEHAFLEKKLRFDFMHENRSSFEKHDQPLNDEGESVEEGVADITNYNLLLEWILTDRIGVGIETSLKYINTHESQDEFGFGNMEIEAKFIPWMDKEHNFVTAFSFGLGIPVANEEQGLGEGRVELEPGFLWFKSLAGFSLQGQYVIATELGSGEEPTFFKYNHSVSYPIETEGMGFVHSFVPMFEILGNLPLQGESEDQNQIVFVPGFRANFEHGLSLGFGAKFPVGRYKDNEFETLVTLSKHFD